MMTDIASWNAGAKRMASLVSWWIAICVLAVQPAFADEPGSGAAVAAPAGSTPAQAGSPATGQEATPPPGAEVKAGMTRADCEKSVATLSSGKLDKTAMESSSLKTVAQTGLDLVTCRAVRDDSDSPCQLVAPDQEAVARCREKRSMFHEIRANPNGRGFVFNDVQWEDCQKMPWLKPYCSSFRAAARSGDASKCASMGPFASNCRALVTLDKSLCRAPKGKEFEGHDANNPETYGERLAEGCVAQVEQMAYLAKGLKAAAESGPEDERGFAKAALGQADACAQYTDAAVKACLAGAVPPPSGAASTPPRPTVRRSTPKAG